ncbi:DUF4157 domain-containing protein [Streptomyces sp. NPDC052042]|uniref:DUF4157 domain-containing protein n=1 Tax=Streptomyces sp. NPDC052042 TaxID=3365683 RepID=UPI0037D2937C
MTPVGLMALQASVGNAAVIQMLRQAGHPWAQPEKHQHTAESRHQRIGQNTPAVQRSAVHDVLRTPGRPLDATTRADMEARLGADFSDVCIHTDNTAKDSAAEVGARAYTSGNHIVIGENGADKHTLAHELTHVIQQRQGPVAGTDNGNGLKVSDPSDRYEREAEANARRALSGSAPAMATTGTASPHCGAEADAVVQRRIDVAVTQKGVELRRDGDAERLPKDFNITGNTYRHMSPKATRIEAAQSALMEFLANQPEQQKKIKEVADLVAALQARAASWERYTEDKKDQFIGDKTRNSKLAGKGDKNLYDSISFEALQAKGAYESWHLMQDAGALTRQYAYKQIAQNGAQPVLARVRDEQQTALIMQEIEQEVDVSLNSTGAKLGLTPAHINQTAHDILQILGGQGPQVVIGVVEDVASMAIRTMHEGEWYGNLTQDGEPHGQHVPDVHGTAWPSPPGPTTP